LFLKVLGFWEKMGTKWQNGDSQENVQEFAAKINKQIITRFLIIVPVFFLNVLRLPGAAALFARVDKLETLESEYVTPCKGFFPVIDWFLLCLFIGIIQYYHTINHNSIVTGQSFGYRVVKSCHFLAKYFFYRRERRDRGEKIL
jgi:hypothetical protein